MKNYYCLLMSICLIAQLPAQATFTYPGYESEKEIVAEMHKAGIPGLSIAIVRNFKLDTVLQWGYADLANQEPVQKNTLFQAGSITSGLTAVAILQAVEAGLIDLDADINQYLKSWQLTGGQYDPKDPVSVQDLLLKSRGFTQNQKPKGYAAGSEIPSLLDILNGTGAANTKAVKLRSKTHEQEHYSFETEVILMQLLEDVYGQDFRSLIKEKILRPSNVNQSSLQLHLTAPEIARAAIGYNQEGKVLKYKWMVFPETASAGWWSTAEDMAQFTLSLLKAYQGTPEGLLSKETMQVALKQQHQSKALIFNNWREGSSTFGYGGAPKGYYSTLEANPDQGWAIVILCNKELQWQFVNELRDGLKEKYDLEDGMKR
jgi:CubicO group peptidase (beta-lactamase class C family)